MMDLENQTGLGGLIGGGAGALAGGVFGRKNPSALLSMFKAQAHPKLAKQFGTILGSGIGGTYGGMLGAGIGGLDVGESSGIEPGSGRSIADNIGGGFGSYLGGVGGFAGGLIPGVAGINKAVAGGKNLKGALLKALLLSAGGGIGGAAGGGYLGTKAVDSMFDD
jgi:hypothetical protein